MLTIKINYGFINCLHGQNVINLRAKKRLIFEGIFKLYLGVKLIYFAGREINIAGCSKILRVYGENYWVCIQISVKKIHFAGALNYIFLKIILKKSFFRLHFFFFTINSFSCNKNLIIVINSRYAIRGRINILLTIHYHHWVSAPKQFLGKQFPNFLHLKLYA